MTKNIIMKKRSNQEVRDLFARCICYLIACLLIGEKEATPQSYYVSKTPDAHGVYKDNAHFVSQVSGSDKPMTIRMLDAVVDAVKNVYPTPIGADVQPYGGTWKDFKGVSEVNNGPYIFNQRIPFFDLYKTKNGNIEASGEATSEIEIWINFARFILQANRVKYGHDRVFRLPLPGISVNGFPKYNNMILLIPPGKSVPWRPATKKEYLENFIAGLKASLPGRSSTAGERNLIPEAERLLASMPVSEQNEVAYLRKVKYSNSKDGFPDFEALAWDSKWAGFRDPTDTTADQLVIIDENYYDKKIPRNSFQLIVVKRNFQPASISAARATKEQTEDANRVNDRLNNIVLEKNFLPGLQVLLGKSGLDYVANKQQKKPAEKMIVKRPVIRNIERILDSLMKNYDPKLPVIPAGTVKYREDPSPPGLQLPPPNSKKISLASRKLNTREELIIYLDELDRKFSSALSWSHPTVYNDANSNTQASYGYWLLDKSAESLLLSIKAAKQQPDNNPALNNLASMLSLFGVDYMAVPLYTVCLKKEPGNNTITNNIGQSWLQLGDVQLATTYLKQAVAAAPYHPHANNSLAAIYEKQGNKDQAIKCYENSLRGAFTIQGFNGLLKLKRESAMKLINYIRHRYRQPDYINFNKYPTPAQCLNGEESEKRRAEYDAYRNMLIDKTIKYERLISQQEKIAESSLRKVTSTKKPGEYALKPFQAFATALVISVQKDFEEKFYKLQKELALLDRQKARLQVEFDTAMAAIDISFEPRLNALGEGNADPALDEDICHAKNALINFYLPLFAEINEDKFRKIVHAYKDYLNDYLYWIKMSSWTEEIYQLEYYKLILTTLRVLQKVEITTLRGYCDRRNEKAGAEDPNINKPSCPLPVGLEIPFVIGKVYFDCETWGFDGGEFLKFTIEHRIGAETTIAFGAGLSFYETPKLFGKGQTDLNPGIEAGAKGQLFLTFDGNTIVDGGFLWEAEIDLKGLGKPAELKQNFTWAVVKGFSAEGQLTEQADKIFGIPPEKQLNKNVRIFDNHQ